MNSACYSIFVVVANELYFSSIVDIIFLADIFDSDCCAVLGVEIALTCICVLVLDGYWLPWWLRGKDSTCQCTSRGFNPGVGKITGGGNGNPLQCSSLGNPIVSGAWWAI